jgi:hypothetical protein
VDLWWLQSSRTPEKGNDHGRGPTWLHKWVMLKTPNNSELFTAHATNKKLQPVISGQKQGTVGGP